MRPPRPVVVLVVATVVLFGAACGSGDDSPPQPASMAAGDTTTSSTAEPTTSSTTTSTGPSSVTMGGETVPAARLRAVAAGLCQAIQQAATDVAATKRTFNSRSHDGLHLIARGLEAVDRAASAALLEAKHKVETDFAGSAAGPQVTTDLRSLAEVTRSSLARFNVTVDACPAS